MYWYVQSRCDKDRIKPSSTPVTDMKGKKKEKGKLGKNGMFKETERISRGEIVKDGARLLRRPREHSGNAISISVPAPL